MDALHACAYLSRVVALPVAVAEAVFDDVTRALGSSANTDPTALGTASLPARRIRTRLGSPIPWAGVPVEVEPRPGREAGRRSACATPEAATRCTRPPRVREAPPRFPTRSPTRSTRLPDRAPPPAA
jgi:hypothetical protein